MRLRIGGHNLRLLYATNEGAEFVTHIHGA